VNALVDVLTRGSRANRLLRAGILVFAIPFFLYSDLVHLGGYTIGVDLEIPLRAAERWLQGGQPYLASAFVADPGATQPFLYPPYTLPVVAALAQLPRGPVTAGWLVLCAASLVVILRRLGVPVRLWLLVAIWPPVLEGLLGGNPQLPAVALFSVAFWMWSPSRLPTRAFERRFDARSPHVLLPAAAAAASVAIKVSHPHGWVYVLRRRPREAIVGAVLVGAVLAISLPLTGLDLWGSWLNQLRLASDPAWPLGGIAIGRLVDVRLGLLVFVGSLLLVLFVVPKHRAGAWVGILTVVGAPSLHNFGMLFLLPAMFLVRAELALLGALLMATTTYEGTWLGIAVIALAMVGGLRDRRFLEAGDADPGGTPRVDPVEPLRPGEVGAPVEAG
jgi:hypothetical protein